jgi:putative hydrolase of the HAD superfamily
MFGCVVRYRGMMLRALLLDLDDTILDNRSSVFGAWDVVSVAIVDHVSELETKAVRRQIAASTRWYWSDPERLRRGRVDLPLARHAILTHALERLGCPDPDLARRTERLYTQVREETLKPIPGAIDALQRLRTGVPRLGLVTNGAAEVQRAKLERFDLARHFDAIVIEGEFGAGKPEARVFQHALGLLDAGAPQSLMAGDDYEADVLGALQAGLHAAWIDRNGNPPPRAAPPRAYVSVRSLHELAELLDL